MKKLILVLTLLISSSVFAVLPGQTEAGTSHGGSSTTPGNEDCVACHGGYMSPVSINGLPHKADQAVRHGDSATPPGAVDQTPPPADSN